MPPARGNQKAARPIHHAVSLEQVERLRGAERVKFWAASRALSRVRLRGQTEFGPSDVSIDPDGHIRRMPKLIGKPCFAQPGVYLRHAGETEHRTWKNKVHPTKCGRCKVYEACLTACRKRLLATNEIRDAYTKFLHAGGTHELLREAGDGTATWHLQNLTRKLIAHGDFTSVNDARVTDHYDELTVVKRRKDAQRKARQRLSKIKAGLLDQDAIQEIKRQRTWRQHLLCQFLIQNPVGLHRSLSRIPAATRALSARSTADAWFGRELLTAQRKSVNPSAVAGVLLSTFTSRYQGKTRDVLRSRVATDLERAARLEHDIQPGHTSPLWPKFDLLAELN